MHLSPRNRIDSFFKDDPIGNFFGSFWDEFFPKTSFQYTYHHTPKWAVNETEDAYEVSVEVPGYSKDQINVSVENSALVVRAKRVTGEGKSAKETAMTRTLLLPEGVDSDRINAELKHGLLKLSIPKPESVIPKEIEIKEEE